MQRMTIPGCRDLSCASTISSSSLLLRLSMSIMQQPVHRGGHILPQARQITQRQRRCRYRRHQRRSVLSCRDCPRPHEADRALTAQGCQRQCTLPKQSRRTRRRPRRGLAMQFVLLSRPAVGICGRCPQGSISGGQSCQFSVELEAASFFLRTATRSITSIDICFPFARLALQRWPGFFFCPAPDLLVVGY